MRKRYVLAIFPIIAAIAWAVTIVTLMVLWLTDGRPKYEDDAPSIAYISNIGAEYDTLFITGAAVTSAFFVATLVSFLVFHRYIYRSQDNARKPRTWSDFLAFAFGLVSSVALVLLAIFDSEDYDSAHWVFTLVFIFSAIICAIFNLVGTSIYRTNRLVSFVLKILFIVLATMLVIVMLVFMLRCSSNDQPLIDAHLQ